MQISHLLNIVKKRYNYMINWNKIPYIESMNKYKILEFIYIKICIYIN